MADLEAQCVGRITDNRRLSANTWASPHDNARMMVYLAGAVLPPPPLHAAPRPPMFPAATGLRRVGLILLALLVAPFLAATVVVALPAIAVLELRRAFRRRGIRRAWEARWGANGMRVVLAYSDDTRWRERIEQVWLPRIGRQTVILPWRETRRFLPGSSIESQVFDHWAGDRDRDPIAIVIPREGRVRTLHFREAFNAHFGGQETALTALEARFFALVESFREPGGVVAPAHALNTGVAARRDA